MERYIKDVFGTVVDTKPLTKGELFPHESGVAVVCGKLETVSLETPITCMSERIAGKWIGGEFIPVRSKNVG